MDKNDLKAIGRGFAIAVPSSELIKTFVNDNKKISGRVRARKIALNIWDDVMDKLLENGEICPFCELNGTFCEGLRCDVAKDAAWDDLDRQTRKDLIRSVIGNKYYNLSLTVKNELLCI